MRGTCEEASRHLGDVDRARPDTCLPSGVLALRLWRLFEWAIGERVRTLTWLCERGHTTDGLRLRRGLKLRVCARPDTCLPFGVPALRLRRLCEWATGERVRRLTWLRERGHSTDGLRLRRGLMLLAGLKARAGPKLRAGLKLFFETS